ncbi:MAG: NAD(+) kinase, partial [Pseudohongiellaceae bacterium]
MQQFKTIGLVGRPDHSGVVDTLQRLIEYLNGRDLAVILDADTATLLSETDVRQCSRTELSKHCDLVIVVGGDGSMLNVAKAMASDQVAVIGVNRGKLGFLTDILPEELEARLGEVLSGAFTVEKRFLLDVFLRNGSEETHLGSALNDVVLHPGMAAQMIEFELFIDDTFVYSQESDGLIVATPTGSTAYALSAGGPIMHPHLNAVVLVPMYPHSLSSRPIVVDGDSEIRLMVAAKGKLRPQLSCDGEERFTTSAGDELIVR